MATLTPVPIRPKAIQEYANILVKDNRKGPLRRLLLDQMKKQKTKKAFARMTIPCDPLNIHAVSLDEKLQLHFHNHNIKDLKKELVGLKILNINNNNKSEVSQKISSQICGCCQIYRVFTEMAEYDRYSDHYDDRISYESLQNSQATFVQNKKKHRLKNDGGTLEMFNAHKLVWDFFCDAINKAQSDRYNGLFENNFKCSSLTFTKSGGSFEISDTMKELRDAVPSRKRRFSWSNEEKTIPRGVVLELPYDWVKRIYKTNRFNLAKNNNCWTYLTLDIYKEYDDQTVLAKLVKFGDQGRIIKTTTAENYWVDPANGKIIKPISEKELARCITKNKMPTIRSMIQRTPEEILERKNARRLKKLAKQAETYSFFGSDDSSLERGK